jgi:sulfide:quinone oxidoreductase
VRKYGKYALIAGGGVAALEAMLALRHLSGHLLDIELVSPASDFHYRPLRTAEPFEDGRAPSYSLSELTRARGARHRLGGVTAVDPDRRAVQLANGQSLDYDFLLLAIGAQPRAVIPGALTFWSGGSGEDVRRVLEELEAGLARRVVFAVPPGVTWALPLYELALQAARRLKKQGIGERSLMLVTPERSPLEIFGGKASAEVEALLLSRGIELATEARPKAVVQGELTLEGGNSVAADRVVALPRLYGPELEGVSHDEDGFIPTDENARVQGLEAVYAAGDATTYPVKQGGVAAQQADAAAEMIAREVGAPVVPKPFRPVMRGVLLTGELPRYMRTVLGGEKDELSAVATHAFWWPPSKIAGRYLAPYLSTMQPIGDD